jgi:hypothetical protein
VFIIESLFFPSLILADVDRNLPLEWKPVRGSTQVGS